MIPVAADPWTRRWTIVRADTDIAHVMLRLSDFQLENVSASGSSPVYQIAQCADTPVPDCFAGALLHPVGAERPSFFDITKIRELPPYTPDTDSQYVDVCDLMSAYLTENTAVQRLEGQIRMTAGSASSAQGPMADAARRAVSTTIHLYQFSNAVKGGMPLLLVRAPLSSACVTNGDGTAAGVGKT